VPHDPLLITVEDDHQVLAQATGHSDPEHHAVHADLHVEAGHLPVGTRTRLVDAVLDQPTAAPGTRLQLTLPAGDGEILNRLRERCHNVETRVAGSTCLATGAFPED